MLRENFANQRLLPEEDLYADLVITGGGLSGVCCAITAARAGIKVLLVQDRPVLGGNSSSEVRLWILGATSHMGNNNRWAREGGVVDEILVENMYRNPEGNPIIFDTVLLDKVVNETNITLLLNTAVYAVNKKNDHEIASLRAFCSQNQTAYTLHAPLFCDASGDGIVGFLAGAPFRMGAEKAQEFGEAFAPDESYGELLGHSLYFYTKDVGKPVAFKAPSYILNDIKKIPRFREFNAADFGCKLWWIEYGGRLNTVYDTEKIKWELWKIVYCVWDHIKNSGKFPEAASMTLEWVGTIPGKRESRRFEGDYMLNQKDIVQQRQHIDAIGYGGWSIDLHPADGIYSEDPGCNQWHTKGIYQVPYRCLHSSAIHNLFLGGRIISASHVAFGSSRVMATAAYLSQAVGMAAMLCKRYECVPAGLQKRMPQLQLELTRSGQYIPGAYVPDEENLVQQATLHASSELVIHELPENGGLQPLDEAMAQMIPVTPGFLPDLVLHAYCDEPTELKIEIRRCSRIGSYTPDVKLADFTLPLHPGRNCLPVQTDLQITDTQYLFIVLHKNPAVKVPRTQQRITGILSVFNTVNPAVSNYGRQQPPKHIGIDAFEFWVPKRRPGGQNIAMKFKPGLAVFGVNNLLDDQARPTTGPNAWVADSKDQSPALTVQWKTVQRIRRMVLSFDTDFDHPMESVLMTHPENVMPFCVRQYTIMDDRQQVIHRCTENYQTRNTIVLETPVETTSLQILLEHPSANTPAALFHLACYES